MKFDPTRFVGIPFLDGGSERHGCDCWGLVRLIYKEHRQIELPIHSDVSARDLRHIARRMQSATETPLWMSRETPEPYDIVLMRVLRGSVPAHVGICVNSDEFIHVEDALSACVVPFSHPLYIQRIVGFYGYRGD